MPEINSVAGQLVGIPVGQVYTAGPGIKIDNVNKTISAKHWVKTVSNPFSLVVANTFVQGTLTIVDGIFAIASFNFNPMLKMTIATSWVDVLTVNSAYASNELTYGTFGGSEMNYPTMAKISGNTISMNSNVSSNAYSRLGSLVYALATPVNEEDVQ